MKKEDIIIISRDTGFYIDDLKMIDNKEESWEHLKILHDLTHETEDSLYYEGTIICENTKTGKIEVLNYE